MAAESTSTNFIKEYKWYNSYSLPADLQCVVVRAEFSEDLSLTYDVPAALSVETNIICNQMRMQDQPACTLFSQSDSTLNAHHWGNLLCFPSKVRDLALDAILTLTVRAADGSVYCGTSMRMFDENGALKQGKQKLMLFFGREADPTAVIDQNTTPGEYYQHYAKLDHQFIMEKRMEVFRATSSQGSSCEWLDKLLQKRITDSLAAPYSAVPEVFEGESEQKYMSETWGRPLGEIGLKKFSFLIIELPIWPYPVLYEEKQYQSVDPHYPPTGHNDLLDQCISEHGEGCIEFSLVGRPFNAAWLTVTADWDMDQENLSEEQNRRLCHNVRRGATDSSAKPNKDEKKRIDKILQSVRVQISTEDMDFLYRFRYSLTENKKALTKFLNTVNWDEETEVAELPILLSLWKERAPIDVADALKLLSKEKSFEHQYVREYAVSVLRSASDEELLTFLLQLVQALRYEPAGSGAPRRNSTQVEDFAMENSIVGVNHLSLDAMGQQAQQQLAQDVPQQSAESAPVAEAEAVVAELKAVKTESLSPLGNFLVDRACASPVIANYLYWYLKVEMDDEQSGPFFQSVFDVFIVQLSTSSTNANLLRQRLMALDNYIREIILCQQEAIKSGRYKDAKEKALQKILEAKKMRNLMGIDWVPMPLDPGIKLTGLIPNTAMMFSSAVYPCVIEFTELLEAKPADADGDAAGTALVQSTAPKTRKIMFKSGDDLRQDQLIMQMIALMDSLLKKVNLDLKLLTYGILAVGQKDGIMEFVRNSMPISAVMTNCGSVLAFLKHHNPDKAGLYGVSAV